MKLHAARLVPVRFAFEDTQSREEGWGKLVELAATHVQLMTRFRLIEGERLNLHFELAGQAFDDLRARVARIDSDLDGYFVADLEFSKLQSRLDLGRSLRNILSRI